MRDAITLEPKTSFFRPSRRYCTSSPNGNCIAAGMEDGTLEIWDLTTGARRQLPHAHDELPTMIKYSPNGQILAAAAGTRLTLWDVGTFTRLADFEVYRAPHWSLYPVAFSPEPNLIALATSTHGNSKDQCVLKLWNVEGEEQATIGYIKAPAHTLAFSADGRLLAAGSFDGSITVWDVEAAMRIGKPLRGHTSTVNALVFSPDSKRLVSGADETVRLWDTATGENILTLRLDNDLDSVGLSPDGLTLAASSNGIVRCWRAATERQVKSSMQALNTVNLEN